MENDRSMPGGNKSDNMYTYQEDQKNNSMHETGAIRRSLGEGNPNANPQYQINNSSNNHERTIGRNSIIVEVDQSPPLYWMFFMIFGIIQIVFIILFAAYYNDVYKTEADDNSKKAENDIKQKYKLFQEINIMIYLGFSFLRSFLKHYSWSSITLTLMGGVLSFEFALFFLICFGGLFQKNWNDGKFNFEYLLDASYCSATFIISLGAILGKLSLAQYFVMVLVESILSTLNYILLRQSIKIIDIGGALTVHLFGAIFGGVFSLFFFFTKQEKERISNSPHLGTSYNSNIFALFGSLILISYWPAFNTALIAKDNILKYRGIINTYLSILGSIVGTFCVSPLCNYGKLKIQDVLNACFSGGIVVAGCCHIIQYHWLSLLIGVISGALTTYLCNIISFRLKRKGYHDTSDVFLYHGIPGFLGGIFSTIFVGSLKNWNSSNPGQEFNFKDLNGRIANFAGTLMSYNITLNNYKDSLSNYAGMHFASIFITLAIAAVSGFVAGFTIKFCNCNIAIRYFNDSEFFDVSDSEAFPWEDEQVELQVRYNSRT